MPVIGFSGIKALLVKRNRGLFWLWLTIALHLDGAGAAVSIGKRAETKKKPCSAKNNNDGTIQPPVVLTFVSMYGSWRKCG